QQHGLTASARQRTVSPAANPLPRGTRVPGDEQESLQSTRSSLRVCHPPRQARHRLRSARRTEEIRQAAIYGTRPRRKFREAATRYLTEFAWKRSIERDARALKDLNPFVGDIWLDCVHNDSFKAYIDTRRNHPPKGCKPPAAGTINCNLAVARRMLNLAARLWRDKGSTLTWLAQ